MLLLLLLLGYGLALAHCVLLRNSFEMYLEPPGTLEGLSGDSLYEEQVKYKTKMLGNIKLVGWHLSTE